MKSADPVDRYVGARIRMRRLMLKMSQARLGDVLGLTFQQVQKYEKGSNRIGASRLQHVASILQVPVAFFFDGAPGGRGNHIMMPGVATPESVIEFLASTDGVNLVRAFTRIDNAKLRRRIVNLVEQIGEQSKD